MYALGRGGSQRAINIWPGFVDALATLLLVVIFVLMVSMVAQYFQSIRLTGKEEALQRLQREIFDLAELLALERSANADLRIDISQLSSELQSSLTARDSLQNQLAALAEARGALEAELKTARSQSDLINKELEDAYKIVQADKEKIETQLAQLALLQQLREDLTRRLTAAEQETAQVSRELEDAYKVIDADKDKIQMQLSEIAILKSLRDEMMANLAQSGSAQDEQRELTSEAQAQVLLLNRQIAALRKQLARLESILEVSEAANKKKEVQIADLGRRLNVALATKVQELARYRSEFFGRLREVLGDRKDVRIVGDRFVFQSEVLFASGSAELGESGQEQLAQLATTLQEIAAKIPGELDWILRVDGHTDVAPISTYEFPSNWELSTARATSVVKFLIGQGISAKHLAAAGFGEFQPLDAGLSGEAFRRNRRIELKLTSR
jgi:chemotaxis protein MotB